MMKRRIVIGFATFGTAFALLALNAVAVPAIVNNLEKTKVVAMPQKAEKPVPVSENVPNLKVAPIIPVSTVSDYMRQTLTQDDLQAIYKMVDSWKNEAEGGTRDMTEDEIKRRIKLEDRYVYDGVRPQKKLPLVKGDSLFYFDSATEMYYYPERALTDEELLEFIDFSSRINYALALRYAPQAPKPSEKDIKEAEAVQIAKSSVEKLFDVDTSLLDIQGSFNNNGPTKKGEWFFTIAPYKQNTLRANGETFFTYVVMIDSLTGDVTDITKLCSTYKMIPISEDAEKEIRKAQDTWIKIAEQIVKEKQGDSRKIVKAEIVVENNKLINGKRGYVDILVEVADKDQVSGRYTVSLLYTDKSLHCLSFEK